MGTRIRSFQLGDEEEATFSWVSSPAAMISGSSPSKFRPFDFSRANGDGESVHSTIQEPHRDSHLGRKQPINVGPLTICGPIDHSRNLNLPTTFTKLWAEQKLGFVKQLWASRRTRFALWQWFTTSTRRYSARFSARKEAPPTRGSH